MKTDKPKLFELTASYTQESDSNDDTDLGQDIKITMMNAGAGNYFVIETRRWAVDKMQELIDLLRKFERKIND